jgi:hypothetical protein
LRGATSPEVSRRRPTSAAHEASATICDPGNVVPTGVPGLRTNWIRGLGHASMSSVKLTLIVLMSEPKRSCP